MQPNAISNRYLVGSIISGIFMFISGIVGVILFVVGKIFTANPEDVKVEINGRLLEGKEAAEKALEIGKFFSGIGGVLLVTAFVLLAILLIMIAVYSKNKRAGF